MPSARAIIRGVALKYFLSENGIQKASRLFGRGTFSSFIGQVSRTRAKQAQGAGGCKPCPSRDAARHGRKPGPRQGERDHGGRQAVHRQQALLLLEPARLAGGATRG